MRTENYTSWQERGQIELAIAKENVGRQDSARWRMTHDNFDMEWLNRVCEEMKITQSQAIDLINQKKLEPQGTMTFTDESELIIPPNPNLVALQQFLADPHSGLPDLEAAFIALAKLYLGV